MDSHGMDSHGMDSHGVDSHGVGHLGVAMVCWLSMKWYQLGLISTMRLFMVLASKSGRVK
jgi:hypothetical protein